MDKSLKLHIINNCYIRSGMSGGERIIMELARHWSSCIFEGDITLYSCNIRADIWRKNNIDKIKFKEILRSSEQTNMLWSYLQRIVSGIIYFLKIKLNKEKKHIIYSSSDFWPDVLPALIYKLRNPKAKWIAGFYMFAPKPWQKDSPYKGKKCFIGLFYWLTQLPIYWIVKRCADMVFVTSEPDVEKFITKRRNIDKITVIRGGVDIKPSVEYLNSKEVIPVNEQKYDAVFVGRFHLQKGVIELVDIWKLVCQKKPDSKLAMIGIGSLKDKIKGKIKKFDLENNIELLGFKDGIEKYEIFKQSKIVVHPAIYDSGGMAAAEAMAWGLPGVSFDLEALKTYYPKGMIKTPCFDLKKFAENILRLLEDEELYKKTKEEAISWATEWDWDKRAGFIFDKIFI